MNVWCETKSRLIVEGSHKSGAPLTAALRRLNIHFGYVDDRAIAQLASIYGRSKAEMLGVVSYYSDFRRLAPGKHILRICQAEACQAVGARELIRHATKKLGISLNETTPDNLITLEPIYCLGLCATGPAVEMDGQAAALVSADDLDELIGEVTK